MNRKQKVFIIVSCSLIIIGLFVSIVSAEQPGFVCPPGEENSLYCCENIDGWACPTHEVILINIPTTVPQIGNAVCTTGTCNKVYLPLIINK